ncbi:MAG: hydrogenase maturation protease [Methanocellales archaeon]|nr:hydrogenase maturation protease [Methanocellales archaeon]
MMRIHVLGCGNLLVGDDGFGVHVLKELEKRDLPSNIELIEAGTGGLDILNLIESTDKAIIIDAVKSGGKIGNVYRFTEKDLPPSNMSLLSLHDLGLADVLKTGRIIQPKRMPKEIIIIGCEVQQADEIRLELSPDVAKAVPVVVDMVLKEVGN